MKREIIERLSIDSAAGELNEDTETLFRTYLAEHPESNKWATVMSLVYGKAEAGIIKKTGTFKGDIKSESIKFKHSRFNLWPVLRWAAVVILAACIGATVGRWSKSDTTVQRPGIVAGERGFTEQRPVLNLRSIDNAFWRDKAVGMLSVKPHSINGAIIHSQGLWDRYRQYIKEKYNE